MSESDEQTTHTNNVAHDVHGNLLPRRIRRSIYRQAMRNSKKQKEQTALWNDTILCVPRTSSTKPFGTRTPLRHYVQEYRIENKYVDLPEDEPYLNAEQIAGEEAEAAMDREDY